MGQEPITAEEAFHLSVLFGVAMFYLLDKELRTTDGKSLAYTRWYDRNKKLEEEYRQEAAIEKIVKTMKKSPWLIKRVNEFLSIQKNGGASV